ncbi:uncharacterized protein BT62DRAFT_927672 [Guyanagaster necrorhizus]|uniref:Uncharacterized protein n=1 Tax=Guyanagaster necrorhizus TaxID=856835 RepID=A0A9P7W1C3_9AGAR|nr:uncharacterized protein BT62DRAFT_927672 [Guyanagaster necrorhizus MCA 3950]KAG7450372.1 hypothetical protein BT62DRAFT_927672 [Guyanagaster necrorhizus MCA 3950]
MPPDAVTYLSLSDDAAVESVLADIPFFCIGIMAFGISTFFLVMKQVNLSSLYLYLSALLAFTASIFDLSQLLARGGYNVAQGYDTNSVQGLIDTREVSLGLSLGLRFMFFWTFVAERPRGEPPPILQEDRKAEYESRYHAHSASWQRWGYLGFILKWGLLALTVAIPIMQIIWRIFQRQFGLIYTVESTIEIVVSSLFLLKLFLNIFLSLVSPWWLRLLLYLGPIAALLISLGIGIGQLIFFAFSETTLGRFLQAVELYIMIVFLLIHTFYVKPEMCRRQARVSSFNGLGGFRNSESLPKQALSVGTIDHNDILESTRNTRESVVLPGSRSSGSVPLFLWDRNDPELGDSTGRRHSSTRETVSPASDVWTVPRSLQSQPPIENAPLPLPASRTELTQSTTGGDLPPLRPKTGVSFSSYYLEDRNLPLPSPKPNFISEVSRSGPDSPIYGLDGIITAAGDRFPIKTRSESRNSRSTTSFDELLRQQSELDQSIAALRLFSPQASTATTSNAADVGVEDALVKSSSMAPTASTGTGSYTGVKADSSSVPSEFSLSIFPEPPTDGSGLPDTPAALIVGRSMAIPSLIIDEVPSIPTSPNGLGTGRFGSAGTQYDVTSFIGGLTHPTGNQQTSVIFKGTDLSDVESMDENPTIVTGTNVSARPLLVNSVMPPSASLSSRQDSLSIDPVSARQIATLRPFLLGNVTSAPSPLSGTAPTPYVSRNPPIGPRRPIPILGRSVGYRLLISGPKPTEGVEEPDAYERPRQAPLIESGGS